MAQAKAAISRAMATARTRPTHVQGRADVVDAMLASLSDIRKVRDAGAPEERKAMVRNFLRAIRIEKVHGRAVLCWYRLPEASYVKLVAVGGIEPPTRGL